MGIGQNSYSQWIRARQEELFGRYRVPVIALGAPIPAGQSRSALHERAFYEAERHMRRQLAAEGLPVRYRGILSGPARITGFIAAKGDVCAMRRALTDARGAGIPGRLFLISIYLENGERLVSLPREQSAEKWRTAAKSALARIDAASIAQQACRALLYEVCVTPKPGLVDRENNGSHKDMNMYTFMSSAAALWPYFQTCANIGIASAPRPAPSAFAALRRAGRLAEGVMLAATGGINAHKGAIFLIGIVCAALGRLPRGGWRAPERVAAECAAIARGVVARDFARVTQANARTTGQRLYAQYGIAGARGQAEAGFPAATQAGLPALEAAFRSGCDIDRAGGAALMAIIARAEDTNMIARSNREAAARRAREASALLARAPFPNAEILREMNEAYAGENLSPGGSADLLAVSFFLYFMKHEADI